MFKIRYSWVEGTEHEAHLIGIEETVTRHGGSIYDREHVEVEGELTEAWVKADFDDIDAGRRFWSDLCPEDELTDDGCPKFVIASKNYN